MKKYEQSLNNLSVRYQINVLKRNVVKIIILSSIVSEPQSEDQCQTIQLLQCSQRLLKHALHNDTTICIYTQVSH